MHHQTFDDRGNSIPAVKEAPTPAWLLTPRSKAPTHSMPPARRVVRQPVTTDKADLDRLLAVIRSDRNFPRSATIVSLRHETGLTMVRIRALLAPMVVSGELETDVGRVPFRWTMR